MSNVYVNGTITSLHIYNQQSGSESDLMFLLNFTFTKSFLWEWSSKSYNVLNSRIYYLFIITFGFILLTSVSLLTSSSSNEWISTDFISCLNESIKVNAGRFIVLSY